MTTLSSAQLNNTLVEEFTDWLRLRNLSSQSIVQYESLLRRWVDHLDGYDVRRATPEQVSAFLQRPRGGRAHGGVGAPATRNRDRAILSSFYGWLAATGEVDKSPILLVPAAKVRNRRPKALTDDVWLRLWSHAEGMDRVWLGLGYWHGLRRAEICELRPDQLDFGSRCIVNFTRKGGHEALYPWGEVFDLWLERLPNLVDPDWPHQLADLAEIAARTPDLGASNRLFQWAGFAVQESEAARRRYGPDVQTEPNVLNKRLARLSAKAGLPAGSVTPHALRHSFVTNMLRMGVPLHIVQVLAAHSSAAVTARYMAGSRRLLADWRGHN